MDDNMIRHAAMRCTANTIEDAFVHGVRWALDNKDRANGYSFNVMYYDDPNSGNRCEIFVVTDYNGNKVYERDYGSVGGGFAYYVNDYFNYINGMGYKSDITGY